jgi:hypothetical protein
MACVVGYLRRYRRWDGSPGLSLDEQRALVRTVAREREYHLLGRAVGWQSLIEELDGQAHGWPVLRQAIRRAMDGKDHELMVVVPTLDGVQYNLSFLGLLARSGGLDGPPPVYVYSGWRRPGRLSVGTNYEYRTKSLGWLLTLEDEADAFAEMVAAVRQRNRALSAAIRGGLARASARGVKLGASRRRSYRLSRADREKGGAATARQRRAKANDPYRHWVAQMLSWRAAGNSLGVIALKLAEHGVRTPAGRPVGPMLVHRILQRAMAAGRD